jgi:hypothetical protein
MVLRALSEANVDQAPRIVEAEPTTDSFRLLREALVSTHTLSEYQMVDHIVNMEPLNDERCKGWLNTVYFNSIVQSTPANFLNKS